PRPLQAPPPAVTPRRFTPEAPETLWSLDRAPALPAPEPEPAAPAPAPERGPARRRRFAWPFGTVTSSRTPRRPVVIALVGPTGAGKTTTMAKLANHSQAFGGRRVGILCLDTYRIAGVEQARQYAELSKLPFEVAWDTAGLARALRRLKDCE